MSEKESDLQTKILNDLRSFGKYCECFKIKSASDNGEPDIFFTTKLTNAVLVEVKRLNGKARDLQLVKINKLNTCGTKTFLCHSWSEWVLIKKHLRINMENLSEYHNRFFPVIASQNL